MIGILKGFFTNEANVLSRANVPQSHRLHVATCAILMEMARRDGEFSDAERQAIITIFKNKFNLSDNEISCIIDASEEELERSIDLWQFTNQINKNYSPDEKIRIIETVWQIAYSDGRLDRHEDYLMHKLSELLNVPHKHLIDAKLKILGCGRP